MNTAAQTTTATGKPMRVIPATRSRYAPRAQAPNAKKRVAPYARVSTDNDEQLNSYEAQVDHYTRLVQENDQWELVKVYTDEGISATNTKKRDGFNEMVADALAGKIDMIITKSVSRFARNTVDSLVTIRQLKEKGVGIWFEKENIDTLDAKGELLITLMSSLAQEESRSISENVTWGKRKSFADGKISLPYKQFLGYRKGVNGLPEIVEEEAAIVRRIYRHFLEGKSPSWIAKRLTAEGIPTPGGKQNWRPNTVESILTNEKYRGDAMLQKSFTVDFLTKKTKVNEGEVQQYYITDSHPAIIPPEVFEIVQGEIAARKAAGRQNSSAHCFSGKVICGECGGAYGSKVWHSNDAYRRVVWQCNRKYTKGQARCATPHLTDVQLEQAFVKAFSQMLTNKDSVLAAYRQVVKALGDTSALDEELAALGAEAETASQQVRECVEENARSAQDQAVFQQNYGGLFARYEEISARIATLQTDKATRSAKRKKIAEFLRLLERRDELIQAFDEEL